MLLTRRRMLQGTAAHRLGRASIERLSLRTSPAVPIVFVHGDSDLAATWETQMWRFESNGYPRDRLFAISFTDPQARDDDTRRPSQPLLDAGPAARADGVHRRRQGAKLARRRWRSSRCRAAAMRRANMSRPIRRASAQAALGGTPNHGVFAIDGLLGSEYNGRGPFLKKLDAGDSEVTSGVPFLTSAQRWLRPLRAARRRYPLSASRACATQRDRRRTGAEGRDERPARRSRSSRGRAWPGRLRPDLQVHHRPCAGADRDRARG